MCHMKRNTKWFLFVFFLIFISLIGSEVVLFRHSRNYDVAAMLHRSQLSLMPQATKRVSSLSSVRHVFVIVDENHDWESIYHNPDAPYINNTLLTQGAYAKDYHNIPRSAGSLHPSEPNYLLLETGMIAFPDHTFTTDDSPSVQNSTSSHTHLTYLLKKNGYTWKSYQEDISGTVCPIEAVHNYAPKHNPFVFFRDVSGTPSSNNTYCQTHIRPLSELSGDLQAGMTANYTFITPNLQNDMHDGTIAQGDTWLSQVVPMITHSSAFKQDGALFITWDEGSDGNDNTNNNPIGMIIRSPFSKANYSNSLSYSHASLVKTIEEIFHLSPLLGTAADSNTSDLSDFFMGK